MGRLLRAGQDRSGDRGRLNSAVNEIINAKANSDHLTRIGYTLTARSVPESQTFLRNEVAKWGQWVKSIGISVK